MSTTTRLPDYTRVGSKKVYWLQDGERATALCDCEVYTDHCVEVHMTLAQALEIAGGARRSIQDILPDVAKEVREVFISGTTPAEWDELFGARAKPAEAYGCYRFIP